MKVKVTIDIFSGRPNPELEMDSRDAKKIIDAIPVKSGFKKTTDKNAPEPTNLGFRGIIIEQVGKGGTKDMPSVIRITPDRIYDFAGKSADAHEHSFEDLIFDKLAKFNMPGINKANFKKFFEKQVSDFRDERANLPPLGTILTTIPPFVLVSSCACAPPHEIAWWNDGGQRQLHNNCYNYASNYRTDTFAQPGRANAKMYTSLSGCTVAAGQRSARDGAIADALIATPLANNQCPSTGHLVALVIAPGFDFHWYRKGPDGKWSHKPGSTKATLVDNSNNPIPDPRTANRGPYTQFCTFMQVIHGHIKIS
jgi:hypothetical protein